MEHEAVSAGRVSGNQRGGTVQKERTGTPAIVLDGVSKWFETGSGRFDALQSLDLSIERGDAVAVVGKSGSGKSTLLNLMTGIDHPSSGRVTINGDDLEAFDESRLARWRGANIGIVFQFFQLIPTLTVFENLLLSMEFVGVIAENKRSARAASLLEQVGILQHQNKYPASLSGGEQQRAAIARAMANDPPILVADEPTGNLDHKTSRSIESIFSNLVEQGTTLIVVTHEAVSQRQSMYRRVVTLEDGIVIGDESL